MVYWASTKGSDGWQPSHDTYIDIEVPKSDVVCSSKAAPKQGSRDVQGVDSRLEKSITTYGA